jgi:hypothetical protein
MWSGFGAGFGGHSELLKSPLLPSAPHLGAWLLDLNLFHFYQ